MEELENTEGAEEIRDPKAVLEALERAKADAKRFREMADAGRQEIEDLKTRISALSSDETLAGLKRQIVELRVKSSLEKEGIKDTDRVYKYLSHSDYELDDSGNVKGFEEDLKRVKNDLPELFDKKRRVGGGADLFSK